MSPLRFAAQTYKNGFVKNKVLEFAGPGVKHLPMDFRIGIDVMTTETACLSSIWETDEKVEEYLAIHGRPDSLPRAARWKKAHTMTAASRCDLSRLEPMAALPFHPSEAVHAARVDRQRPVIICERWKIGRTSSSAAKRSFI